MKALYTHVSLSLVFQCEERSGPSASGSIGGASPPMRLAIRRPEPHAIVQPKVPCPALRNRLEIGVAPTIGVLSGVVGRNPLQRSEEHTSELQSLMRISYAVFCLKKKKHQYTQ